MSLLDSDDDPSEEESVSRSQTGEPLFGDTTHRGKARKADKRGTGKPMHWSKQKENVVLEKTPKKVKGQSSAKSSSVSKTPPDSPKSLRPSEVKGVKGTVTPSSGLLPSPNVKGQRKRYSQLSAGSSSSEDELVAKEGSLFSNKPALRSEVNTNPLDMPTNPFLEDHPSMPGMNYPPVLAPPTFPTGTAMFADVKQQLAWVPAKHHSLDHSNATLFDLPSPAPGHTPSMATGAANPLLMMGDAGGLVDSPPLETGLQELMQTNPFLSTNQFSVLAPTFITPPPPSTAPPTGYGPAPSPPTVAADDWAGPTPSSPMSTSPPLTVVAEDWDISQDLHGKCVQQFNSLEPVKGLLLGDKAREFFVQSKLPNQELSAIWRLSDVNQDNALSQEEFCIAMKLVLMRRKGVMIPSVLPQKLLARKELEPVRPAPPISTASSPALFPVATTSSHTSVNLLDMHTQQSTPELKAEPAVPPLAEARGPSPSYNLSQDEMLVHIDEETSPEPRVGQIISLDDSPLATCESPVEDVSSYDQDDSMLVKLSSGSDSEGKSVRPVRPAPPKPHAQKQSVRALNRRKSPPGRVGVASNVSPPLPSAVSAVISPQTDTVPILRGSGGKVKPAKPPRPSAFVTVHAVPKKSAYSTLLTSPPPRDGEESVEEGGFNWRQLAADPVPSSADEATEKGHSRSTSLDLNKMLLGQAAGDVFGGMPSAVPPEPPPKQKASSPPPPCLLGGVNEEEEGTGGWTVIPSANQLIQPRQRSLSTGSIASTGGGASSAHGQEEHYTMDTSTDALLLVHHKPPPPKAPKPRKVPILPPASRPARMAKPSDGTAEVVVSQATGNKVALGGQKRPPPPGKPNRLAELYRGGVDTEGKPKGGGVSDVGVVKDKGGLQASIRSLKENNEALIDINGNLEQKLFTLMEERVRLARDLNLLSGNS